LWHQFKENICDDLARAIPYNYPERQNPTVEDTFDYGLYLLDKILIKSGKSLKEFPSMPAFVEEWGRIENNALLHEQLDYNHVELAVLVAENVPKFNERQQAVYNAVLASVNEEMGKSFFLHSAGGGGKTFVCNTVAAAIRLKNKVAFCVASSGIASLLLDGGCTSHSCFHIPIPVHETSFCRIKKDSPLAEVLKSTGIIIWDEVPMQHRYCIEALDCSLREVLGNNSLFGGITVLFGGDFHQILPVVP
jgi:hypothetical protein